MKKQEIAKRIAKESGLSEAEAADRLDRVVHHILASLKRGRSTPLPGIGKFTTTADGGIRLEPEKERPRD